MSLDNLTHSFFQMDSRMILKDPWKSQLDFDSDITNLHINFQIIDTLLRLNILIKKKKIHSFQYAPQASWVYHSIYWT